MPGPSPGCPLPRADATRRVLTCRCWAAAENGGKAQRARSAGPESVSGCGGQVAHGSGQNGLRPGTGSRKCLWNRGVISAPRTQLWQNESHRDPQPTLSCTRTGCSLQVIVPRTGEHNQDHRPEPAGLAQEGPYRHARKHWLSGRYRIGRARSAKFPAHLAEPPSSTCLWIFQSTSSRLSGTCFPSQSR